MTIGDYVRIGKKDGICVLVLNRPETRNVLSTDMLEALGEAVAEIGRDDGVRVIVITGDTVFSAGADIKEMRAKTPEEAETYARLAHGIFNGIEAGDKPVIAAINGYALGGGCELALACDIRIAAAGAKFGQPELNLGIITGFGGTQRLPRLVGPGRAKELIMTSRIIDAREAETIGLVNRVVEDGELISKAEELALTIAQKSLLTLRAVKGLVNEYGPIEKGLEKEILSFAECFASEDRREGMNAFIEKRRPEFRGH
ncbi:MAG TPA: enoyl-CoA hydratase-related protein [Thermodesulfovibrionales bacterium]|nr:enoyl-CoA hydratase-related protein [Thermodesulfovibrionales bacterium]